MELGAIVVHPGPVEVCHDGWSGILQPCYPQRRVSANEGDSVTAQCVPWTRRRSRGREEHQKRDGPKRGKNERRPEEYRQPAENANTDEAIDEHEERPHTGQSRSANRVRSGLLLSFLRQQLF